MVLYLFILVLGISIMGADFPRISILGIESLYCFMAVAAVLYCRSFVMHRGRYTFWKAEWYLLAFCVYGILRAGLSMLGITDGLVSDKLLIDTGYIPRQAYYLFFLPLILMEEADSITVKADETIQKYRHHLFFVILLASMLYRKEFSLHLTTVFLLAFLTLSEENEQKKWDWLLAGIIMMMPIAEGGEMTNALVRVVFLLIFLVKNRGKKILVLLSVGIWGCIALCFVLPIFLPTLEHFFDANTLWRAEFWHDELKMLTESRYLGVGYGTSYCSSDFINPETYIPWGPGAPFAATEQYSIYDKVFVTAAHNSFVTMAFRLGIIGIVLFAAFLVTLNRRFFVSNKSFSCKAFFVYCASLIIITLNVGLESPYYMLMFVFAMSYGNYKCKYYAAV